MPYKSSKIKIENTIYDRRVKLTHYDKLEILQLRAMGLSYQKIANRYEVSKKLVIMVCNPEIAERNKIATRDRHREGRYTPTKEERNKIMREHRQYKAELYRTNKI